MEKDRIKFLEQMERMRLISQGAYPISDRDFSGYLALEKGGVKTIYAPDERGGYYVRRVVPEWDEV